MLKVCKLIEKVAPTNAACLLLGESGTGKEVLAKSLHSLSTRNEKPFVAINCAALPENLFESELFGYEKGAFTGAVKTTPGKFELANGGTIFLDEIGEMPLLLQAKLLRFLQEKVIERVGGRTLINLDTRIICATNRDLEKMMANGDFREDLYYRIAEIQIDNAEIQALKSTLITTENNVSAAAKLLGVQGESVEFSRLNEHFQRRQICMVHI